MMRDTLKSHWLDDLLTERQLYEKFQVWESPAWCIPYIALSEAVRINQIRCSSGQTAMPMHGSDMAQAVLRSSPC